MARAILHGLYIDINWHDGHLKLRYSNTGDIENT